jgi:hypothetical protein
MINWQIVIYFNWSPNTINEKLDYVLATGVVDWVAEFILGEYLRGDESLLIFPLEFIMCSYCQRRQNRTVSYFPLHNFITCYIGCNIWSAIYEVLSVYDLCWANPLLKMLHLFIREWQKSVRVFIGLGGEYTIERC